MFLISLIGIVFFLSLFLIFWSISPDEDTYIPGEKIAGLTAGLSRSVPDDHPKVIFTDATKEAGINFNHFPDTRTTQLPEDMGSGVSWGDYDNDGWDDLFIPNFSGNLNHKPGDLPDNAASQLYHNNQDGTFSEAGASTGTNIKGYVYGGTWLDYNNDGWLDLFLTCYGQLILLKNNGNGKFLDITVESGLSRYEGFWTGAASTDFDQDGYTDIYVCGYVDYQIDQSGETTLQYNAEVPASLNPSSFPPTRNLLFRNQGDGTFREVAKAAGVGNENGRSLSAAWIDLDEDGWMDLYVANDVSDNALFRNRGDGTFEDISYPALVADYRGAMGIGVGDWDHDEDLDLFITHWMAQENALYSNLKTQLRSMGDSLSRNLRFMDEADRYGLGQSALEDIGFGISFFDFDNDGWLDLFLANGSTFQERDNPEKLIGMQDKLYWNRGPEHGFFDVSSVSGSYFSKKLVGRGAACSDYDRDGDLDLFISNHGGPGILLRNDGGNQRSWLQVYFPPVPGYTYPGGIRIRLITGKDVQVYQTNSQGSYLSQHSSTIHFGLGNHEKVDTLRIIWPDRNIQEFTQLKKNIRFTVPGRKEAIL